MASLLDLLRGPNRKQQAIDEYNLGLAAKYRGEWAASLAHNLKAAELDSKDEATWWNLGIAATALRDWKIARRAWLAFGVVLNPGTEEVLMPNGWGCVRLVPDGSAEVVWGTRIDPARIKVENVPLPSSERRYGDIILNDGAQEGTRVSNGQEYAVMNELELWQMSEYSTYGVEVEGATDEAKESLSRLCEEHGLAFEDWGTIRVLCEACSKGNPGEHACADGDGNGHKRFGFAARSRRELDAVLAEWREIEMGVRIGEAEMEVAGLAG